MTRSSACQGLGERQPLENYLIAYKGAMQQETLVDLGGLVRRNLDAPAIEKAVFSIFVEMAQNLQQHSAAREKIDRTPIGSGLIVVREAIDAVTLRTVFPIDRREASAWESICRRLAKMDARALRLFFRRRRKESTRGHDPELGLIHIARKTREPLEFVFQDYDNQQQLFSLTVRIAKGGEA